MSHYGTSGTDVVNANSTTYYNALGGDDIVFKSSGTGWLNGGSDTASRDGWIVDGTPKGDQLSMYYAQAGIVLDVAQGRVTGAGLDAGFAGFEVYNGSQFGDAMYGSGASETFLGWGGHDYMSGGDGNDWLSSHDGNDTLDGGGGRDFLSGGSGNDVLRPGADNDEVDGGFGVDTLLFAQSWSGVSVDLGVTSRQYVGSSEGSDIIRNVENVAGSAYADSLRGNGQDNRLSGAGGNDTIYGRGGDDLLLGGAGRDRIDGDSDNDTIIGGQGADHLYGGSGADCFEFYAGDTGNVNRNEADIIWDFDCGEDKISLPSGTDYHLWYREEKNDTVVWWHDEAGFHDIVVKGDDPAGCIETDLFVLI